METVRTVNSTHCPSARPAVQCKIHGQSCPGSEECWMVDKEDDWSDNACIKTHLNSFSIHEACYGVLLQCRRYRGVGLRDQGEEFDQFINDLGSTLKAFEGKQQSTRGCRLDTPWYARQDDYDIIQWRREPVVRLRNRGRWTWDNDNMLFEDPDTTVTLEVGDLEETQPKSMTLCPRRKPFGSTTDTFAQLPEELRTEILTWLPSEDVAALRLASRAINDVQLSASFWYSRLNAPELQMVHAKNVKAIGAGKADKKEVLFSIFHLALSRMRIARMAYQALWYAEVCSTIRKFGIDRQRWLANSSEKAPQKVHSGLQSERIAIPPEWFSTARFDIESPFRSFKVLTLFFYTPRRYYHSPAHGIAGEIEHDRYLTGIRFENRALSKDLGHCQGQDTMQVEIPSTEYFESLVLRIDTNNSVSVQSLYSTEGDVRKKHEIYWSRLARPFRARFEEISFSDFQEIELGLTRECRVVVFDVLTGDSEAVTSSDCKRPRLR